SAENRGVCPPHAPAQRDRRHTKRTGTRTRTAAGALSRSAQGAAPELSDRRRLQRQKMAGAHGVGDASARCPRYATEHNMKTGGAGPNVERCSEKSTDSIKRNGYER